MESTFTFRVDADLKQAFEAAAKALDLSASQLLRAHMRDVVRKHAAQAELDLAPARATLAAPAKKRGAQ